MLRGRCLDQKILFHILAERIKSLKNLVQPDQYAYVKNRNIHEAIWNVKNRLQNFDDQWCLVGLDCTKAFDRVDRKYMFQVLRLMKIPEVVISLIERMYEGTSAYVNVNGHLTSKSK